MKDVRVDDVVGSHLTVGTDMKGGAYAGDKGGVVWIDVIEPEEGSTSWCGDRSQLRVLIEALRQADAETRMEREVIVRYDDGVVDVAGLAPGKVHEVRIGALDSEWSHNLANRLHVEPWVRATLRGTVWGDAPVTFVGFPEEPNEG